jgi:tetratricopeptide (TPR) repeat protein
VVAIAESLRVDPAGEAQASALAEAAMQLLFFARGDLSCEMHALIDRIPVSDPAVLALVQRARAYRAFFAGDLGATARLIEASARSFEEAGDLRNACQQQAAMGYARMILGLYSMAERALREAREAAERMNLATIAANTMHNLGLVRARHGAFTEALDLERRSAEAFAAQGDRRMETSARQYLAHILMLAQDLAGADAEAVRAVDIAEAVPSQLASALANLADVRLAMGKKEDALSLAEKAHGTLRRVGGGEAEQAVLLTYAEALHACGDVEAARAQIAEARRHIEARALKINDLEWRRSFLEEVPENARILQRAREWGT